MSPCALYSCLVFDLNNNSKTGVMDEFTYISMSEARYISMSEVNIIENILSIIYVPLIISFT